MVTLEKELSSSLGSLCLSSGPPQSRKSSTLSCHTSQKLDFTLLAGEDISKACLERKQSLGY